MGDRHTDTGSVRTKNSHNQVNLFCILKDKYCKLNEASVVYRKMQGIKELHNCLNTNTELFVTV